MPLDVPSASSFVSGEIVRPDREWSDADVSALLEPEVAAWFARTFGGKFTPPQLAAVPLVHERRNVLISSPTGTGKTLSAFLAALNELVALAKRGELRDRIYVVYVSPLKALNNDVERNLEIPLAGIRAEFERRGLEPPAIRTGVRTGDTPASKRSAFAKKPPHVLITTPESLAIMLSAPKMGQHLRGAKYVLVDEVHALAGDKRGVHLALSLERLSAACAMDGGREPVRVGLSATVSPLEDVARFLFGDRGGVVVDVSHVKLIDLEVECVVPDPVGTPLWEAYDALYRRIDKLISTHRTTLVFTNTRSGTERLVLHLKQKFGSKYAMLPDSVDPEFAEVDPSLDVMDDSGGLDEELGATTIADKALVAAHHGSLSKETRLEVEEKLKRGELKCVVCSTSLELGIDIGYVDLVILLGSPKGISRALQRVGRSGHKLHETSKGKILVLDRDDLVECVVLAERAREKKLDAVRTPRNALDVLAQQLIGMSLERPWSEDEAFALVRRAAPYATLPREDFDATLSYVAGDYPGMAERRLWGRVWREAGRFGKRGKLARAVYAMNVGTIPDTTLSKVFAGERYVGQVEEAFAEELKPKDVFVLGGNTWVFEYARGLKVQVAPARGRRPTVPIWGAEQLPLSPELAGAVRAFRAQMRERLAAGETDEMLQAFVENAYHVNTVTASAIVRYFREQARFLSVPAEDEVLVEEFVDDELARVYVFHTVHGRRANDALARAFAKALSRERQVSAKVQVSDNGFAISLPRRVVLTLNEIKGLFLMDLMTELEHAVEGSELLKRRARHVFARAFLVLRNYAGREATVGRQQLNATILLHVLRRMDPQFPVVRETFREVYEDALDVETASALAYLVLTRRMKIQYARQRRAPSPFAHNLVVMSASDVVLMEDRKKMLQDLHERVQDLLLEDRD